MKVLYGAIVLVAAVGLAGPASAQNKVNIVYPIQGATYPITDPAPGTLSSHYLTASFSVTCSGGSHNVEWSFDTDTIGSAKFYDQISVQQVWKLPGGKHLFWVDAGNCGKERVTFKVGQ